MNDPTNPQFWDERYRTEKTPWDLHRVPATLGKFLRREREKGRVLVPGCGSGYEVRAFLHAGHDVQAIDFSQEAVNRTRSLLAEKERQRVVQADFFTQDWGVPFDLVYERTFLCALPPSRRPEYAQLMGRLIRSGGKLVGFFFYGPENDPPPFPLSDVEAMKLFGEKFDLVKEEPVPDSLPIFSGKERWQEWARR